MIRKSFFGLTQPRLDYTLLRQPVAGPAEEVPPSKVAIMLVNRAFEGINACDLKAGDSVALGQKVEVYKDTGDYFISPLAGTIKDVDAFTDARGGTITAVTIEGLVKGEPEKVLSGEPSLSQAAAYLENAPGGLSFRDLLDTERAIDTIVILGMDQDLLVTARQQALKDKAKAVASGVKVLRRITKAGRVVMAVPPNLAREAANAGCEVVELDQAYPSAQPELVLNRKMGLTVPTGGTPGDVNTVFFTVEAVASLGVAYEEGVVPMDKVVTLIMKDGTSKNLSVRVGTPVGDVLSHGRVFLNDGDRIVLGGPMRGTAIYSLDMPVLPDTDAVMVQDRDELAEVSDYPCVNCGECVRICPARIPINDLIRLLENGMYEEGARQYDLLSCVECGLCSYVCIAQIPIFQYIMLGKHELARASAEA
ncbi:MAG: 4Fe-4S dicluster domain-containing protein [Desulfatibacillaceae bacterium]